MKELAEFLRTVDPFSQLPDSELAALCDRVEVVDLEAGCPLFNRGDVGDRAYVVLKGHLDVTSPGPWQPLVLAMLGPGDLVGESALLRGTTRNATVTARTDSRLVAVGPDDLKEAVGAGAGAMMQKILDRWDSTRDQVIRAERMAQVGTLAAGVAHELNNPAAAVQRSSQALLAALERLDSAAVEIGRSALSEAQIDALGEVLGGDPAATELDPLQRAELEEALRRLLEEIGVENAWTVAGEAAAAGIDDEVIERLRAALAEDVLGPALEIVVASAIAKRLAGEIGWAAAHMSEIARDLGQFSRLGEAPVQDVDIVDGLEHTLRLVAHRLDGIEVVRLFDPEMPSVVGAGSELNQVWTNLVANAADAAGPGGTVTLRAFGEGDAVVVEVEDDGPGIAPENLSRIFDPFFTTKPPGSGTGLGLPISHRIVVADHRGDISVDSAPGRTVFRVVLPVRPDA